MQLPPQSTPCSNGYAPEQGHMPRSLSIGTWGLGESAPVVTASGEGWFGLDDSFAGSGHSPIPAPPNAYPCHHPQNQYYFPSLSPVPASEIGSRGTYLQPPHSPFYGPSPSPLQYTLQPPPAPTSPSMTFTSGYGYEYDVHHHVTHPRYDVSSMARVGAAPGAVSWGLDNAMTQDYWYGSVSSQASGYYPNPPHPHAAHNHHLQQLVHPYELRGGLPQIAPESFASYAFPSSTSPISLQPVATPMGLPAPPQLSVQSPSVATNMQNPAASATTPIEMNTTTGLVPSPSLEAETGLAISGMTSGVSISAGTSDRNQLNLARIADGQDTRTTVMIKNIPNKMSDRDLLAYIWRVCPRKIDFLYLRMDFRNGESRLIASRQLYY